MDTGTTPLDLSKASDKLSDARYSLVGKMRRRTRQQNDATQERGKSWKRPRGGSAAWSLNVCGLVPGPAPFTFYPPPG